MSLYLKYRPKTLEEIVGNSEVSGALEGMLGDLQGCPHSFLFSGPTGCGKTTIGRIIATRLKCVGSDFREIDSADFRGIDTVREIRKQSQFKSLEGPCRVWLVDECFSKGTLISMANGLLKPIEEVIIGDEIKNINGIGKIKHTFKNKIPLNRVVKIKFSNEKIIICSEDHLFLTPQGWLEAKYLKNNFVYLNKFSNFVPDINSQILGKNGKGKAVLSTVPENTEKESEKVLFQKMLQSSKRKTSKNGRTILFNLWEILYSKMVFSSSDLWKKMWQHFSRAKTSWAYSIQRIPSEIIYKPQTVFFNRRRGYNTANAFGSNEGTQPCIQSKEYFERVGNQTNKRDSSYLERGTRWKREINNSSNDVSTCTRMENRSSDQNKPQSVRQFRFSSLLQNRYRKSRFEIINRSRWKGSQIEKNYITRSEKNKEVERIRVESIEIYKQGSNDKSFKSIIGDTERNQKFVTFYDLEVNNHPSYFAQGIAVHNCHKLTNDAQNALLKILEDTPPHVYFILCTTDPHKLLKTIQGRCSQFTVKPLNERQMFKLLRSVVKAEGQDIPKVIYEQITQDSFGHPRNALQILDQVLRVDPEQRLAVAKRSAEEQSESIELCRALIAGDGWKKVSGILNGLKDQEPEGVRRHVMGYAQAVLLKVESNRAALVLEEFREPFFNGGFSLLVLACYIIVKE